MNFPILSKAFGLLAACAFANLAYASDKIDRDTETPIPRSKNLYGIGVAVLPKTSGADEYRVLALPVINANYGDRFYINALQGGVWLFDSDDKRLRLGLSTQARIGWNANDGALTQGMQNRKFSMELGPALRWQTDYGTFNAQWGLDIGNASKGQTLDTQFNKNLYRGGAFKLNGSVGATWNDRKFNAYYFGVAPNETSPMRPAYAPGSGTELRVGLNGTYAINKDHYLLFGTFVTRLSDQQANSPIVQTRTQPFAYFGYSVVY